MRLTLMEDDNPSNTPPSRLRRTSPSHSKPKPAAAKKAKAGGNPGTGKKFIFHGAFNEKADAEKKGAKIEGSFIRPIKVRGKRRFAVLQRKE